MNTVNLSAIPSALQDLDQWILWRAEPNGKGELTKVPFVPGSNRRASSTDASTWCNFTAASAKMNGDGLGFVFTREARITGVDIDDCVDAEGQIAVWAARIVARIGSYAERSPGDGVHILVKGAVPEGGKHKVGSVEMYNSARFFTVTGNRLANASSTINQADIGWLHRLMCAGAFNFAKNPKLRLLLQGDIAGYASQSEADLALAGLLARLGLNAEDIDSAFRLSALCREKWEQRSDYREETIRKALQGRSAPARISENEPTNNGLLYTEDGRLRAVVENVLVLLRDSAEWSGVVGYDLFGQCAMMLKAAPGFPPSEAPFPRPWTDRDDVQALGWMQRHGVLLQSTRAVGQAVQVVAFENPYHPVKQYLESLVWDGAPRVDTWLPRCLGCEDTAFARAVGACTLIAAIARIYLPGCKHDACPLLIGEQGTMKSTAVRELFGTSWFSDHVSDLTNKDSRIELQGRWCIELAELSAVRRSEIERVKAYLSCQTDVFRPPYGTRCVEFPRQVIFIATSNDPSPLTDASGARRFWPIHCGQIDVETIRRERDQLWAESLTRYRAGESWWLKPALEASAREAQAECYEQGARDSLIRAWIAEPERNPKFYLDWFESTAGHVHLTDVLIHCLGIDKSRIDSVRDRREVAAALRFLGYEPKQERSGRFRGERYYVSKGKTE